MDLYFTDSVYKNHVLSIWVSKILSFKQFFHSKYKQTIGIESVKQFF